MKKWIGWIIIIGLSVMIGVFYLGVIFIELCRTHKGYGKVANSVVLEDDFEGMKKGRGFWSLQGREVVPVKGRPFLGPFGSDEVLLQLSSDMRSHDTVTISFDLYLFGPWNGNGVDQQSKPDLWELAVEQGPTLVRTTFLAEGKNGQTQAYPDNYPEGRHPARTGAKGVLPSPGRTTTRPTGTGSVYHMSFIFPHDQPFLLIKFRGELSDIGDKDKTRSWGLDNVKVTLDDIPKTAKGTIPRGKPGVNRAGMNFNPRYRESSGKVDWDRPTIIFEDQPRLLDLRDDLTVSAWVRCGHDSAGPVFWRGSQGESDQYSLGLDLNHPDNMVFRADSGPPRTEWTVESGMARDGLWHFWTGVRDRKAGKIRLYRDGVLKKEKAIEGFYRYNPTSADAYIGTKSYNAFPFYGEIAEVQIWKTAQSPQEILHDMQGKLSGKEPGLVACWVLYEDPGYVIKDIGPNQIQGTMRTKDNPGPLR